MQESNEPAPILPNKPQPTSTYGGSVAAKIMARYGFKEGQGLGRMEQGMSSALQVSKLIGIVMKVLHIFFGEYCTFRLKKLQKEEGE